MRGLRERDFNGDGTSDIVTATGAGGGNTVRVWNGVNGNLMRTFTAFSAAQSDVPDRRSTSVRLAV